MKLPVCNFDIESNMLCPNCQDRLDNGDITKFDVDFSKWLLEIGKQYPELVDLHILRAIKVGNRLILIVKKRQKNLLLSEEDLLEELKSEFGDVMVFEKPLKLRSVVRSLIAPAVEVGVNSLHLPTGVKESIVMLRDDDKDRISFTLAELRGIVSGVMGESVIFEFQGERVKKEEDSASDEFDKRMREIGERPRRMR
ncbi:MAG: hypothetical protein RTU30_04970 [Candidatus Thorarchaeota archaeon]